MAQQPLTIPLAQALRGLRYTVKAAQTAGPKYEYIHVSTTANTSKRHLTGAPKIWAKPESQDEVYGTRFRISGKPEDIRAALLGAGFSEQEINNEFANYAITRNNYQTTMAQAFATETANYKTYSQGKKLAKGAEPKASRADMLNNILWWALNLDKAELVSKSVGTVVSGPSGKGSRNVLLSTKFQEAVAKAKYINLNKWDPASLPYATGARVVDPPTSKSRQFFVTGLPFLVDRGSINKLVSAVTALGLAENPAYTASVQALNAIIRTGGQTRIPTPQGTVRPPSTLSYIQPTNLPFAPVNLPLTRQ